MIPQCVGCGYCCQTAPCALGAARFGATPPCKALRYHDDRYWCGIVEDAPEGEKARLIEDLAIGAGCSSSLCNTVRDAQVKRLKEKSRNG